MIYNPPAQLRTTHFIIIIQAFYTENHLFKSCAAHLSMSINFLFSTDKLLSRCYTLNIVT